MTLVDEVALISCGVISGSLHFGEEGIVVLACYARSLATPLELLDTQTWEDVFPNWLIRRYSLSADCSDQGAKRHIKPPLLPHLASLCFAKSAGIFIHNLDWTQKTRNEQTASNSNGCMNMENYGLGDPLILEKIDKFPLTASASMSISRKFLLLEISLQPKAAFLRVLLGCLCPATVGCALDSQRKSFSKEQLKNALQSRLSQTAPLPPSIGVKCRDDIRSLDSVDMMREVYDSMAPNLDSTNKPNMSTK